MAAEPPAGGGRRPRACVVNLGCRVNRVESDWIEEGLARAGCALCGEGEAELVVVNTCGVTGEAQAKTRKAVRHAAQLPARPVVVACGCVASLFPDELASLGEGVVVAPSKLTIVDDALAAWGRMRARASAAPAAGGEPLPGGDACEPDGDANLSADDEGRTSSATAARAAGGFRLKRGVKVQDGCDNRCTYCIVWKARGASRSVPVGAVEAQVRSVLAEGAAELDLTGVNLGRFQGRTAAGETIGLAGLIDLVAGLARGRAAVRASSLEPQDVGEGVLEAMARNADVVCAHLHLPVQSGCDATLARMGRPYRAADFLALAERARALMPGFSLTTDVICGFPGETDAEFEETLAFCRKARFSKMHVFRYSPRPGTPAAGFAGQVPPEVARARAARLRALGEELRAADAAARVGTSERVLVEAVRDGTGLGTSASFHRSRVAAAGGAPVRRGLARARVTGVAPDGTLLCELGGYVRVVQ